MRRSGLVQAERGQLGADLRGLDRALVLAGVGAQQAGVHLLLREGRLAPAEIAHHLGAVREGLPAPQPHHAVLGRRVPVRPVDRAGLLLHHPPAALALRVAAQAAVEVVVEAGNVGVAGAGPARLLLGREEEHLREAQRIAVPGGDVEVGGHLVVVELGEEAHEVVRHRPPGRVLAQDLDLLAVEGAHLARGEAAPVEPVRRVRLGDGQGRQIDLVERAVDLAPEDRAPGRVERVDRGVALDQPAPEALPGGVGQAQHRVVAAVFVVGLPGHDRRVAAVALGHRAADAARFGAVARVREAVVAPRAEAARAALQVDGDHVGHAVVQHFGGVAVGVHITTPRPAACSVSTASSSQVQSKRPGSGSMRLQANSAMRTTRMPIACMRRASSAQIVRGQCSG